MKKGNAEGMKREGKGAEEGRREMGKEGRAEKGQRGKGVGRKEEKGEGRKRGEKKKEIKDNMG